MAVEMLEMFRRMVILSHEQFRAGGTTRVHCEISCDKGRHRSEFLKWVFIRICIRLGLVVETVEHHNTFSYLPNMDREQKNCNCGYGDCSLHKGNEAWNAA